MQIDARWTRWLAVVMVGVAIGSAHAQTNPPTISNSIMTADRQWRASERQAVQEYVDYYAQRLNRANDTQVISNARQNLVSRIQTPGATPIAKDQYSAIVANAIAPAMQRKSALARLSGTIVAGSLFGGHAVDMVAEAMQDESPAVRYWAFKAAGQMAQQEFQEQPVLEPDDRRRLLQAARGVVKNVKSGDVREQMYDMLARLQLTESRVLLMEAMEERLGHYVKSGLDEGLRAERTGFRRLYLPLVEAQVQGRADQDEIRMLVRVTSKYLRLIGAEADEGISPEVQPVCLELLTQLQSTLGWGIKVFNADFKSDDMPKLRDSFKAGADGQFAQFRLNVEEWVARVKKATGLTKDELALPKPEQAADRGGAADLASDADAGAGG